MALAQFPAPQSACSGVARGEPSSSKRKLRLRVGACGSQKPWAPPALRLFYEGAEAPRRLLLPKYLLLWDELLGFPMYLRMGFRFLSSRASFSFLGLLLC